MTELKNYIKETAGIDLTTKQLNEVYKICTKISLPVKAKKKKFCFETALKNYGFDEGLVEEFMIIRKARKGVDTERAFNAFIKQIELAGADKNELLYIIAVEKQWRSFNHKWNWQTENKNTNEKDSKRTPDDLRRAQVLRYAEMANSQK